MASMVRKPRETVMIDLFRAEEHAELVAALPRVREISKRQLLPFMTCRGRATTGWVSRTTA